MVWDARELELIRQRGLHSSQKCDAAKTFRAKIKVLEAQLANPKEASTPELEAKLLVRYANSTRKKRAFVLAGSTAKVEKPETPERKRRRRRGRTPPSEDKYDSCSRGRRNQATRWRRRDAEVDRYRHETRQEMMECFNRFMRG